MTISSVERAVCTARAFTSLATTEKPRPASPARAASMVAFSASRLVRSAMSAIMRVMAPMAWARPVSSSMLRRASSPAATALLVMAEAPVTWRVISPMALPSSSAAPATVSAVVRARVQESLARRA